MAKRTPIYREPLTVLRMIRDAHLPASCVAVLTMLVLHADSQGRCYPSQDLLALETGLSERTVRRTLQRLQDARLVHRHYRQGTSNHYSLAITRAKLAALGRTRRTRLTGDPGQPSPQTAHQLPKHPHPYPDLPRVEPLRMLCPDCGHYRRVYPDADATLRCERCITQRLEQTTTAPPRYYS